MRVKRVFLALPLQEDRAKELAGETGMYFLKFFQDGGRFVSMSTAGGMTLRFETQRYQKSVVSLEMAADAVRYTVNTCVE